VLASVGIYAVVPQATAQRTREIGIRIALGATRGRVIRLVVVRGLIRLGVELALGLACAFATTQLLTSMLGLASPADPIVFICVPALFAFAGPAACAARGRIRRVFTCLIHSGHSSASTHPSLGTMRNRLLSGLALLIVSALTPAAHAQLTITLFESGSDVVAVASGSLDLTGLTAAQTGTSLGLISTVSDASGLVVGPNVGTSITAYMIPTVDFLFAGSANYLVATSGSGILAGALNAEGVGSYIYAQTDYVSGATISSTSTWQDTSLATLGIALGTYVWSWDGASPGSGSITLNVVPEPSTYAAILGAVALGAVLLRRRRQSCAVT